MERKRYNSICGGMILYLENPKDATWKLLAFIDEFGKVTEYKINTQKFMAFLYTKNERSEREIQETIPSTITSMRMKFIGINLPKETRDLYSEDYKTLMKDIKGHTNRWKYHLFGLEESILSKLLYYPRQSAESMQSLSNYQGQFL